jgi:hypothetical protein
VFSRPTLTPANDDRSLHALRGGLVDYKPRPYALQDAAKLLEMLQFSKKYGIK